MVLDYSGLEANIFEGKTSNNDLGVPILSVDRIFTKKIFRIQHRKYVFERISIYMN